jgi:phospholipase C
MDWTNTRKRLLVCVSTAALCASSAAPFAMAQQAPNGRQGGDQSGATLTPIKHVVIIVGENRTFDHVFGTYQPCAGQTVGTIRNFVCGGHDG